MGAERVGIGRVYDLDLNLEEFTTDGSGMMRQNEKCREALCVLEAEVIVSEGEGECGGFQGRGRFAPCPEGWLKSP